MSDSNEQLFAEILTILDIKHEPENIIELKKWIEVVGIDAVFKKIIEIYCID